MFYGCRKTFFNITGTEPLHTDDQELIDVYDINGMKIKSSITIRELYEEVDP